MESADDVRASLAVAPLADLRRHEATSPDGRSRTSSPRRASCRGRSCWSDGSGRSWSRRRASVDRRYPERLWQFADHRIPDRLFADEAGRRAYTDALARAALPAPSRPCQRSTRNAEGGSCGPDQVPARREGPAEPLVQHPGGPAGAAAAGDPPGHAPADRSPGPGAPVPDGDHQAGGEPGALDRHPRARARRLPPLAADAALPRASPGEGARDARAHLLQVGGRLAGREPQAEHGGRPGLLQPAGRRPAHHDGDGRRAVGLGACLRVPALRDRVQGLHGPRLLRPEAVPARHDGGLGRQGGGEPVPGDGGRPRGAREGPAVAGEPRHRDLGGGRGGRPARGHEVLARLGAEPRADAPDGHRPRGAAAARDGGRPPGHPRRLHRGRLELRRLRVPLPPGQARAGGARTSASSPSSPRRARASPRASTSTTSATPGR